MTARRIIAAALLAFLAGFWSKASWAFEPFFFAWTIAWGNTLAEFPGSRARNCSGFSKTEREAKGVSLWHLPGDPNDDGKYRTQREAPEPEGNVSWIEIQRISTTAYQDCLEAVHQRSIAELQIKRRVREEERQAEVYWQIRNANLSGPSEFTRTTLAAFYGLPEKKTGPTATECLLPDSETRYAACA